MMNFKCCLFVCVISCQALFSAQPFVEAKLIGQMGNQMFQIAAATSLALDHGAIAVFPDLLSVKEFNVPLNYAVMFSHLNSTRTGSVKARYVDNRMNYKPIPYEPNMVMKGWFQSEKYFSQHKDVILELFAPSEETYNFVIEQHKSILSHPCTVAIHHRCYLKEDPTQKHHPTQTKSYFLKAIAHFPEDALFVVCSNNMRWCRENFADIPRQFAFIENNPRPEGYHDSYDMYLMSMCTHQIISNSSFSWWAAYLNLNPDKIVVAPKRWLSVASGEDTSDVIPESWIAIE